MSLEESVNRAQERERQEADRKLAERKAAEQVSKSESAELATILMKNNVTPTRFFEQLDGALPPSEIRPEWRRLFRRRLPVVNNRAVPRYGWVITAWRPAQPARDSRYDDGGSHEQPEIAGSAVMTDGEPRWYFCVLGRRLLGPGVPVIDRDDLFRIAREILAGKPYPYWHDGC
jgi:hypothetical protein